MYWIIFLDLLRVFFVWVLLTLRSASTKTVSPIIVLPMMRPTPFLNWRAVSLLSSIPHGPQGSGRDDLLTLHVDGTRGSAVVGLETAGHNTMEIRPSRFGIRTFPTLSILEKAGQRFLSRRILTMPSRRSGNCSSNTWYWIPPFLGT